MILKIKTFVEFFEGQIVQLCLFWCNNIYKVWCFINLGFLVVSSSYWSMAVSNNICALSIEIKDPESMCFIIILAFPWPKVWLKKKTCSITWNQACLHNIVHVHTEYLIMLGHLGYSILIICMIFEFFEDLSLF